MEDFDAGCMIERDYILRLVQQFSRMMAHIMGLKEKGRHAEALDEIKHVYKTVLKLEHEQVIGFERDDWKEFLSERAIEEWEMAADLLRLEGEVLLDMNKPEGVCAKLFTALDILKHVNESGKAFSLERMSKIADLEDKLAGEQKI